MIRSKYMSGIIGLLMLLALHLWPGTVTPAQAQGTRKDDVVFNSRGIPLAGATVRICAMPASGQPCSPLALIYSDPALTLALANPTTTDGLGNYFFYAAPGKYEIEISGPGISTKQLPNVIVPSDPSSPTFSSVSTSGAINAFSLSLSGNLTVNGSTTVVGNLASGTLNLSNQGAAPGTPGAGTINLYTKSVDKRLYYKDETGTEIGPIASSSGAQTNIANTFTAAQTIDADFHTKGPNPSYDILRYGGYIGPNYNTPTTGTISSGSPNLTIAAAQDFANLQGILVLRAGPAPTIATPTGLVVSNVGVTGSTTWNYCVVDEDYFGGRTACSAAGITTTGASALGLVSFTIASCNRAAGVATCTTTATHNIISGSQIEIQKGTTGDNSFEGAFTTTSASGTTFTFNQFGVADKTGPTSGTVRVAARNFLKWNAPAAYTTMKHHIYRCSSTCALPANAVNYAYAGTSVGMDSSWLDINAPALVANLDNGDLPATAPTSAQNGWLRTTILSGGGTTSLVLNANAVNTATAQQVRHDNAPNILALCNATPTGGGSNQGATILVPSPLNSSYYFPIASTLNLGGCPSQVEMDLGAVTWLTGTVIPKGVGKIKGISTGNTNQTTAFYGYAVYGEILGNASPLIYELPGVSSNSQLEGLFMNCPRPDQFCIHQDIDTTGGGVTSLRYTDVYLNGSAYNHAYRITGGFGYLWERGGISNIPQDFSSPQAMLMNINCGLGQSNQLLPGIVYIANTYIFGGVLIDSCGLANVSGANNMEFKAVLSESAYGPALRVTGGTANLANVEFRNWAYADQLAGNSTPFFDLTGGVSSGVRFVGVGCNQGYQPIVEVLNTTSYGGMEFDTWSGSGSCAIIGTTTGIVHNKQFSTESYSNYGLALQNGGRTYYQMALPAAPQSAVVSAGGSVPLGTHTYTLAAVDFNGGTTTLGPAISATATSGNQTVTITLPITFPAGAKGVILYRDGNGANVNSCALPHSTTPGGTLVDTSSFTCGPNQSIFNTAGQSYMDSTGITTWKLQVSSVASLVTTAATSDNVAVPGATASSHCQVTPTNASAATNLTTTYVSAKATNQITVTHVATANMNYDIFCTAN